jgi:hypothetical protein
VAKPKTQTATKNTSDQLAEFVAEIDRFGLLLETQEAETRTKSEAVAVAKEKLDEAKRELTESKDLQLATVAMLLKLIRPGQPRTYPLFDQMAPADEETHGHGSDEWRKDPISVLKLSGLALRALIDADIVLVGQLQDRVLKDVKDGRDWHELLDGISDGMADAIEAKLNEFICERSRE